MHYLAEAVRVIFHSLNIIRLLMGKQGDYLLIGFGHNDEKTEKERYTSPVGDYMTEGTFANTYMLIISGKQGMQAVILYFVLLL